MRRRTVLLAGICATVACTSSRSLPPILAAGEIRLSVRNRDIGVVDDPQTIEQVISLANQYLDGWIVPLAGPPVAGMKLGFYFEGRLMADLGLGDDFLTRTHGNFYSRNIGAAEVQEFREALGLANPQTQ